MSGEYFGFNNQTNQGRVYEYQCDIGSWQNDQYFQSKLDFNHGIIYTNDKEQDLVIIQN